MSTHKRILRATSALWPRRFAASKVVVMGVTRIGVAVAVCVLATFALAVSSAYAGTTREFLGHFGSFPEAGAYVRISGMAVDQETGDVYVADRQGANGEEAAIYVFGPEGGPPAGGVPAEIRLPKTPLASGNQPFGLAIDNSCYEHQPRLTGQECEEYDPSYGDMYFARGTTSIGKFRLAPSHKYEEVGQVSPGDSTKGVTVDSQGNVYSPLEAGQGGFAVPGEVIEFKKIVETVKYGGGQQETLEKLEQINIPQNIVDYPIYVAVDGLGDVYVGSIFENGIEHYHGVAKLKVNAGAVLSEEALVGYRAGTERPLAVDPATEAVFVGNEAEVMEFSPAGTHVLSFGSEEPFGGSLGRSEDQVDAIAVDGAREVIYVANRHNNDIDMFGPVIGPPTVGESQPGVSAVTRTSALVGGTANPESKGAEYYFEYVAGNEYEPGAPDPYVNGGRTAIQPLGGAHAPVTVERVALTGLLAGTTYHYRMVVKNQAGAAYGPDRVLTTTPPTPPVAATGGALEVSTTGVTLTGTVDPRGLPTSYVFELGTDTSYGGARLFGNAGSSTGEVPVSVGVQFLVPGTTYHYRLSAVSFDGTSYGQDATFTTPAVSVSLVQPVSEPLIAIGQGLQFPSIAGAITKPVGHGKKKLSGAHRRRKAAVRACGKGHSGKRHAKCGLRARKTH